MRVEVVIMDDKWKFKNFMGVEIWMKGLRVGILSFLLNVGIYIKDLSVV